MSRFATVPLDPHRQVTILLAGEPVTVPEHATVAAAMLLAGWQWNRNSPISGAPRAPYCMMGTCFECLVEIDGVPDRQACLTPVRDGMRIERQLADLVRPDAF